MSRKVWHMRREATGVVLTRRTLVGAPRFDVRAETRLAPANPAAIAHQVRQDLWRALRSLRGFAPVVEVRADGQGLHVTAGGTVAGMIPPGTVARIAAVLDHPGNRARWVAHATRQGRAA